MPVTYKPTNVVISPFIRYSGTSAYNIYIKVDTLGGCCSKFFVFESSRVSLSCHSCPLQPRRWSCPIVWTVLPAPRKFRSFREDFPRIALVARFHPRRIMPSKILPANKSSRRHLNTGSALSSRQEAIPASAEVGPSPSSTPSVSLRGDAESAEVPSSLSGQLIMEITHFPFRQFISRKPLFSTRKPLFSTRKPLFSTRKPLFSTRKPLYFTNNRSWPPTLSAFFPSQEATQRRIDWEDELDTICLAGEVAASQQILRCFL